MKLTNYPADDERLCTINSLPEYAKVECNPFDKVIRILEKNGYSLISSEDFAGLILQHEAEFHEFFYRPSSSENPFEVMNFIFPGSNYPILVKEGFLHIPKKGLFLTKKSPCLSNPERAYRANKLNRDYYVSGQILEDALNDSIQISNTYFEKIDSVPTDKLADCDWTSYLFGKYAQDFGDLLTYLGVEQFRENHLLLSDEKEKSISLPHVRQATVHIGNWSSFDARVFATWLGHPIGSRIGKKK